MSKSVLLEYTILVFTPTQALNS